MCKGIHSLHTITGHAHLDIKLENILVGDDQILKVCDLGLAQPLATLQTKQVGSAQYMAPEVWA